MTVGTKIADLTYPYGTGKAGSYFRRVWSGEDYPKVPVQKGSPKAPPRKVPGYLRALTKDLKPGEWVRISGKPYKMPARKVRPPKRARRAEHAFNCQYTTAEYPRTAIKRKTDATWTDPAACDFVKPYVAVSPWTSNDDIALLGKLRERIVGTDFNLGVFLAEGRESLGMIANAATRIYKAINAVKKGNFTQAARHLVDGTDREHLRKRKATANNWLELQYGWLPLIQDAHEGAVFLADVFNAPLKQRYVARRKVLSNVTTNTPTAKFGRTYGYETGQIIAFLEEKDVVALSGLLDPASIAWEKIPYSFVADWFIPIGNYLAARGLARALKGTFVTTRTTVMVAANLMTEPTSVWEWRDGQTYYYRDQYTTRTISTTLKVPLPSVKPLSKAASWKHCANAVALLTSAGTVGKLASLPRSAKAAWRNRHVQTD